MRIGLSDDSIPVDQLIPELLNLKSIQLKDLENFSDKTVNQFVDEIFKVKTGLNDLAKDTEQAFAHVDTVRKVWKTVGDLKTLPKTLDLNPVSKWNFSKFQNVRAKNNFDLTSFLQAVKAAPSLEDISPVMKVLDSLIPFYSFVNLMEYVNSYSSIFQQYSTNKDNFDSNINRLSSLELKSKDLQVMTEIAKSRVHPKWFNRQVTSGFVDGFLDLEKMENDISDTWIQNALKSEVSFDGLRGLSKLKTEIMALDNMWKVLFKKEDYKNIQLIGKLQSKSDKIASASDFEKVASTVASCNLMSNVKGTEYVRVLTDNLLKLQKTVFAIQTIHQELKKINIEEIKKVPQKASSLIQKINSMTTNYIKHIECISKATGNIEEVASTAELLVGIRKLRKKPEIKKISSSVSKSVKPIASIRKVIEEIKEDSSKEVNELMPFKNLQTYSKPFGDAVTVSMTMMGVSKRKQSLINIAENWHVVEEALETSDFEFRNTWADHHSILRNITQIINVLDNWEKKTQNLQRF
uniref:WSN domain-containing protein n=1 Tax=Caenorhabditis tropicalis TaxID=1561998 RepID=A0A1I7UK04_9PELO